MDYKLDHLVEDLKLMSDFEIHQQCKKFKKARHHCLDEQSWMDSGKIHVLKKMLPEMKARVFLVN